LFLKISIQLTKIINEVHKKNLILNNINSSNILIDENTKKIKLFNFTSSNELNKINENCKIKINFEILRYSSPEITGNINKIIDFNSDLYSLGIIFYEILTGYTPFHEVNELLTLYHFQIAKKPKSLIEINEKIPPIISNIVDILLEKNPEKRYKTSYGLLKDLELCEKNYIKDKNIEYIKNFELMKFDSTNGFFLSNNIFGREKEIKIIEECIKNFLEKNEKQLLIISGESGIGKTEICNFIEKKFYSFNESLIFLTLKFDQSKTPINSVSYFIKKILQIFQNFGHLEEIKKNLKKRTNFQFLIELVPEFKNLFESNENLPSSQSDSYCEETKLEIFFDSITTFLKILLKKFKFLILFYDDLQWSDNYSIKIFKKLFFSNDIKNLFIIGTYRNNEVNESSFLNNFKRN